jgi:hypothetical protein
VRRLQFISQVDRFVEFQGELMDGKTSLGSLRWLLIIGLLAWGTIPGLAQTKSAPPTKPPAHPPATTPVQRWQGGQRTITDAAGRVHVRGERITYAQRRAVAQQRVKAMREAAAKRKLAEVTK